MLASYSDLGSDTPSTGFPSSFCYLPVATSRTHMSMALMCDGITDVMQDDEAPVLIPTYSPWVTARQIG